MSAGEEPLHFQGSSIGGFLGEWDYILGLAAGGKLHSELMAVIELRHLIVDAAQQFAVDQA